MEKTRPSYQGEYQQQSLPPPSGPPSTSYPAGVLYTQGSAANVSVTYVLELNNSIRATYVTLLVIGFLSLAWFTLLVIAFSVAIDTDSIFFVVSSFLVSLACIACGFALRKQQMQYQPVSVATKEAV